MEKNKKILKVVATIIISVVLACAILFQMSHNTDWAYNDWWIKGKTIEEVERKYGEAINFGDGDYGYYIGVDDSLFMPSNRKVYYIMTVDENGMVIKVRKGPYAVL